MCAFFYGGSRVRSIGLSVEGGVEEKRAGPCDPRVRSPYLPTVHGHESNLLRRLDKRYTSAKENIKA